MPADPTPVHTTASLAERLMAEGLLGMAQAAKLLGAFRGGRPTHPATLTRWVAAGVRLADGRTVRLEAIRLNGRLATSRAALVRFVEAQQVDPPPAPAAELRTPTAARQASAKAAAELVRMGC